jgi:hypothetical protein
VGVNLGQVNFSKGELSKDLFARVDVSSYAAGLKRAENVVIMKRGGLRNRMGTRLVAELPGPGRLLPFEFSTDQAYALAMTQGKMQPLALGGAVLEEELEITAVTNANPAQVTIPYHGYETGDEWFAVNVEGMAEINGRVFTITVIDDDNFTIGVSSIGWGVFTDSGGGALRVAPPDPPPTPPVVPPPVEPPAPPPVGGGGGFNNGRPSDGTSEF